MEQSSKLELPDRCFTEGKVYIDLSIFKKSKKLFHHDYENLNLRLDYLYRFIELQFALKESDLLKDSLEKGGGLIELKTIEDEKLKKLSVVKDVKEKIAILNEPVLLDIDHEKIIHELEENIKDLSCIDINGDRIEILSEYDRVNLSIDRGSLNPDERKEIESHVMHTYNFVSRIPWPPEYSNIPAIALGHHEKIDGSGYPYGVKGKDNMVLQSRIMAIADIYDALIAGDRPYKKAVPVEEVIKILDEEANKNKIDRELVDVFIHNKIYEKIGPDSFRLH